MFGKKKKTKLDVNQIVGAAMTAFMAPDARSESAAASRNHRESNGSSGGLGSVGALAVGAALAVTARAAYSRARQKFDLERVAHAVEQRLGD
jgi:homoserine kinase